MYKFLTYLHEQSEAGQGLFFVLLFFLPFFVLIHQFYPLSNNMAELFLSSWQSRSVAMVGACLRLTSNKSKLAISTANETKLVLTDGVVLKQTKSMLIKLVELAGGAYTKTLLGADALERAQVTQWIEYTASKCADKSAAEDSVQNLDAHFKSSTYLTLERMTLADLMLYHALYPFIAEAPAIKMKSHIPSVCRWFDLIQNNEFFKVRGQSDYIPPLVDIPLKTSNAPPLGWTQLKSSGDDTSSVATSTSTSSSPPISSSKPSPPPSNNNSTGSKTSKTTTTNPETKTNTKTNTKTDVDPSQMKADKKAAKKLKKQKAANKNKNAPKGNEAPITPETNDFFYSIDLRVGKITKAWPHPDSDHLWCEEIDVGEDKPRQIASGLREYYKQTDMENRMVVVVCNLKSRKLAGFPSNGMVCCGVKEIEGQDRLVELVEPPANSKPGDRLTIGFVDGVEPLKSAVPNKVAKKKLWEKFAPDFKTNADKQVVWRGIPVMVGKEGTPFTVPTIADGTVG